MLICAFCEASRLFTLAPLISSLNFFFLSHNYSLNMHSFMCAKCRAGKQLAEFLNGEKKYSAKLQPTLSLQVPQSQVTYWFDISILSSKVSYHLTDPQLWPYSYDPAS